jgi:hypothetical protein
MDDNTKNIITLCISGYAALVATVSLTWNIVNTIIDKLSRIRVSYSTFLNTFIAIESNESIVGAEVLSVSIVNSSKKVKYINRPKLKLSYKAIFGSQEFDEVQLINICKNETWPVALNPEEELVLNYPLKDGSAWYLKNPPKNAKIKIMVTDTVNKKYYSKKIPIKKLKSIINHNDTIKLEDFMLSVNQYK